MGLSRANDSYINKAQTDGDPYFCLGHSTAHLCQYSRGVFQFPFLCYISLFSYIGTMYSSSVGMGIGGNENSIELKKILNFFSYYH